MTYATAEERWAAAAQLAAGESDEQMDQRRRRVSTVMATTFGAIFVLILGFGIVISLLERSTGRAQLPSSDDRLDAQLVGMIILMGLGLVAGVAGFVWVRRTRTYIPGWKAVSSPLQTAELTSVRRQLLEKEPLDVVHLPTILAIARQQRTASWSLVPIVAVVVCFVAAGLVSSENAFTRIAYVLASLVIAAAVIHTVGVHRATGRFIEKYAREGPQPSSPRNGEDDS